MLFRCLEPLYFIAVQVEWNGFAVRYGSCRNFLEAVNFVCDGRGKKRFVGTCGDLTSPQRNGQAKFAILTLSLSRLWNSFGRESLSWTNTKN